MSEEWGRFHEWMKCVGVVTFDLELGQKLEYCFPPDVKLGEKETSDVCYMAFPDSNSSNEPEIDERFFMRLAIRQSKETNPTVLKIHKRLRNESERYLEPETRHFSGIAFFRQVRDASIHRGFYQKAVIILSQLPFHNLFRHIIDLTAPEYFSKGEAALESMAAAVNRWPSPIAGETMELPFLGSVLRVRLPAYGEAQTVRSVESNQLLPTMAPSRGTTLIPQISDLDLYRPLYTAFYHLGVLWELTLLGEPLLVMSATPNQCSQAVLGLTSLIRPFHYCNEMRPYFTIHDSDFKDLTQPFTNNSDSSSDQNKRRQGLMLGVTNPFFCKTLTKWPHVLKCGGLDDKMSKKTKPLEKIKTLELNPGFYSKHTGYLDKDKASIEKVVKNVLSNTRRPPEVASAMIRRYFATLTRSFEFPLERYISSLMPLKKQIDPFKPPPPPHPFEVKTFLLSLSRSGPQLTSSITGDWASLYRDFFRRPNFFGWLERKKIEMRDKILELHAEATSEADVLGWAEDKTEVEIMDLLLQMKQKVGDLQQLKLFRIRNGVILQMEHLKDCLPYDTQKIFQMPQPTTL